MVASHSSAVELQRNLQRFFFVITSAACEWFLLFWLFIEATLSFLLKKFACYCKLQIPCIFCSRIDHILGNENPGFYEGLLCNIHKSELSSLFSCGNNGKLVWGHDVCEECFVSSARMNKPNPIMNRLLMHKSGCNLGDCGFQISQLNSDVRHDGAKLCSSCNIPLMFMQNGHGTHCIKSSKNAAVKPNILLPRRITHHGNKIREKSSRSVSPIGTKTFGFDHLSHMGYSELKISSDSESDFPFSDDDEGKSIMNEVKVPKFEPSLHPSCVEPNDVKCVDTHCKNNVSEKNCQEHDHKSYPSSIPELISLDDFPPLCNTMNDSNGTSMKKCEIKFPLPQELNPSVALSEFISLIDAPSSMNFLEITLDPLQRNSNGMMTIDNKCTQVNVHEKKLKSVGPNNTNCNGSGHPAICKGNDSSESMVEKLVLRECDNTGKELTTVPSKNTSALGVLSYSKPLSQECESRDFDDSISIGVQNALAANKVEPCSGLSLDESVISEIEGESTIDHLKRQIEHYKTKISALYAELEEEQSASAVAANQAMAMITRLQEEKASLHMEALQYLRMMEEQAEHDLEALEKANDLLAEKEKEIQDLEAELEVLRIMYSEELATDITLEKTCDLHGNSKIMMDTSTCEKHHANSSGSIILRKLSNINEEPIASKTHLMEFSREKLFISQCLRDLERKLVEFRGQQDSLCTSDGDCCEEKVENGDNKEEEKWKESPQTNVEMNEDNFPLKKEETEFIGSCRGEENCNPLTKKEEDGSFNNEVAPYNGHNLSEQHKKMDLVTLANEISDLNERLEALETDWNFLEHTLNSLEAGREGLHFVRDISYHLQELRKSCMSRNLIK